MALHHPFHRPRFGEDLRVVHRELVGDGVEIDAAQTFAYRGKTIAFCCPNCRSKFVADPKAFEAKVPGLGETPKEDKK